MYFKFILKIERTTNLFQMSTGKAIVRKLVTIFVYENTMKMRKLFIARTKKDKFCLRNKVRDNKMLDIEISTYETETMMGHPRGSTRLAKYKSHIFARTP